VSVVSKPFRGVAREILHSVYRRATAVPGKGEGLREYVEQRRQAGTWFPRRECRATTKHGSRLGTR
jgi:hypothetical protein